MQLSSTVKGFASAILGVLFALLVVSVTATVLLQLVAGFAWGVFGVDLCELAHGLCPGGRWLPGTMLLALLVLAGCWAIWRRSGRSA